MDTRDTRFQNLLFLLSAAPIGMACVINGGDDTDTEAATETPTTNNTTGESTATPDTDPTPMTEGMTGSTGPGVDSSSGPGVDSSTGPGMMTTTGGIELPPICVTYADAVTLCYDDQAGAAAGEYCAETLVYYEMNYGAECVTAFEEWLACLSALTCEEFMGEEACPAEGMMLEMACAAK
jgi:hypothetical protein